jgi:RimJ/RimL family protein N-acetyltransferase
MDTVRLKHGAEIAIRPIGPEDGPRLRAAYGRLSLLSRYQRFHSAKPYLSESEVHYLVDVDGRSHYALVATPVSRPEQIVGVARFVRLQDEPQTAEFSIVVGDHLHRQGLATALMQRLIEAARARGIRRLRATMLAENGPVHALVRGLAPQAAYRRRGTVDEVDLDLAA